MPLVKKARRRTGELVAFDSDKIKSAIERAMDSVSELDEGSAKKFTEEIVKIIESRIKSYYQNAPNIEQIQEVVEEVLSKSKKFERTAKAYMLYRRSRTHARELKEFFGMRDDMKFDVNAIRVLQERYLLKDDKGRIIETPTEMFERVARAVASVELDEGKEWEEKFLKMMKNLEFMPNSPTLMNAGTKLGQLSACFVLPVEDSLEGIFGTLEHMALIQQSGGGTGFSFSHLRQRGDIVKSTKGIASGPVSFIKIFDTTTEVIKQGGKRRGANMGILHASHPDILEFITSKQRDKQLTNFNISVAVDDKFMEAVEKNKEYDIVNPHTGRIIRKTNARSLFEMICFSAWKTGDPGMLFVDEINRKNQVPGLGRLEATNPCGEMPLFPYESCNLGSINLTKVVEDKKIDWDKLAEIISYSVRFLDNVIDANRYPFQELEKMALANRRIGLGVMGFADMLALLEVPYDSEKALELAGKLMSFINEEAHNASEELGKEKGNFPNFDKSIWKGKKKYMRNCACTTIAPTGTISMIAGCSSGIEPFFALAFERRILSGKHLFETNKILQQVLLEEAMYSDKLVRKIAVHGNLEGIKLPERIKRLFKTSLEIPLEQHVKMQAVFQENTDNAVSKTINLKNKSTPKEIEEAYILAYKLKCKGITIYRYGSKPEQALYLGEKGKHARATDEFSGEGCVGWVCAL